MKLNWSHWFYTLLKTVIGGVAATGSAWLGTLVGNQVDNAIPVLQFNQLWSVLLSSTLLNLFFFLKQSPLPEDTDANPPNLPSASRLPLLLMILALAATALLPLTLTGCGSTPQRVSYQSAATTTVTVETALRAYNEFAKAGKTTPEQNAKVKAAYVKYQQAFAVVCDAGAIYAASRGTNSPASAVLQQAIVNSGATITDLINLVTTFGVKL